MIAWITAGPSPARRLVHRRVQPALLLLLELLLELLLLLRVMRDELPTRRREPVLHRASTAVRRPPGPRRARGRTTRRTAPKWTTPNATTSGRW